MDYKEKYEMALEGIQEILGSGEDSIKMSRLQLRLQGIFPELKELEDERIRKEIKVVLANTDLSQFALDYTFADMLAWLEKQGENTYNKELSELLHKVICRFVNDPDIPYSDREKVSMKVLPYVERLEKQGEQKHKIQPKFKIGDIIRFKGNETLKGEAKTHKIISYDNELYVFADGTTDLFCEQDLYELVEQKPTDKVEPKFKKGDVIRRKDGDSLEWTVEEVHKDGYYNIVNSDRDDFIYLDDNWELVEHKLDDKVEPKFRVNDFIVNNNSGGVNQVTKIRDDEYCIWPLYSEEEAYLTFIYIDNDYHLWTIQDAKDGDVLYECNERKPFIFKELETKHIGDIASYCDIFNGVFNPNEDNWTTLDIVPATKEQRALLFQKMEEACYEWDADKKELKKIEQKSAWSEEDEENVYRIEDILKKQGYQAQVDWFKDFKNRVQPKQEWSEKDEHWRQKAVDFMKHPDLIKATPILVKDTINWLKSLKSQKYWKPSDEQILAIETAINVVGKGTLSRKHLIELLKQLKK